MSELKGVRKSYEIGKTIGEGSFAVVKAGRHIETGTPVAIKIVSKRDALFNEESLDREIATMMQCDHPNCVALYQVFDEPQNTYLILELITGGTVMDRIVELDMCSEHLACNVTKQVLNALQYLHNIGIIHRDLKPENILYASNDPRSPDYNTIKLADFGLAKFMTGSGAMKTICGTPAYVAPEVLSQEGDAPEGYDCKIDLWSLGVVVYVMLCGFPPFADENRALLFEQIKRGKYYFLSPYWDSVSDQAKDMVSKMIVVNPEERLDTTQCLNHPWIMNEDTASTTRLHASHRAFLLIRKLRIFESIDARVLQEISSKLRSLKVPAGKYVIRAGEVGDSMYFIDNGAVQVLCNGSPIDHLQTGDFFGEIALTVSKERIADVVSLGCDATHARQRGIQDGDTAPAELLQLLRTDFEELMVKYPVLKSRLAFIGQARVRRQANAVARELGLANENASKSSEADPQQTLRSRNEFKQKWKSLRLIKGEELEGELGVGTGHLAKKLKKNSKRATSQGSWLFRSWTNSGEGKNFDIGYFLLSFLCATASAALVVYILSDITVYINA
uniref:cGMP-dependent protein kinase n=1 Tax=Hanusia phi TaxID=3032 RepID=A0A7S0I2N3_9CRYP|mmetsp:Transcript_87/g.243  ORF Transcript_87/g.243 Transcript_87/m.243 type:complete len:561 (+) Transcript_87:217-1899(+)